MTEPDVGVLIAIPTRGNVRVEWAVSLAGLAAPIHITQMLQIIPGRNVEEARNVACQKALEVGAKYLFFLDDDVLIPNQTLRRFIYLMENNDWDLLTGVVPLKTKMPEPCVFRDGHPGPYWGWTFGEPFEIDSCGMACVMIRTEALQQMDEPWFKWTRHLDGQDMSEEGEDVGFCRRLKETGATLYADGGLLCGHISPEGTIYQLDSDSAPFRSEKAQEKLSEVTRLTHTEEVPA